MMEILDRSSRWNSLPGIPTTFKVEVLPDVDERIKFLGHNFQLWFPLAFAYVFGVFYVKKEMKTRKPFGLRIPLAVWNFGLSLFSLAVTVRLAPELIDTIRRKGFEATFCDVSGMQRDTRIKFWSYLFVVSKVVEFGDTLFVLLKKRDLIFLHWYHHAVTFLYSFYALGRYFPAYARWFIVINAAVHTIMYAYYGMRALGYRFSRAVNISITTTQILQMIFGFSINLLAYYRHRQDSTCQSHPNASLAGTAIFSSLFLLFVHFFVRTYLRPSPHKKDINGNVEMKKKKN